MKAFRGRSIDATRPVCVHRNLRRGGYSVMQSGLVVAHADAIMLADARCVVSRAGWERSRALGKRTVHAWICGRVTDSGMGTNAHEACKMPRAHYDRAVGAFVHDLTTLPASKRVVHGAAIVALNERGMFYAYSTGHL